MRLAADKMFKIGGIIIFSPKDITVVILSRGREKQLLRSVQFWNQTDLRILILHNTQSPLPVDSFAQNVKYIVLEKDFSARCGRAAIEIRSKYAVFCSDDELMLPSGLKAMGIALENNSDIASVGGKAIGIGKYGRYLTATFTYVNMSNYSNYGDTCVKRLENHTIKQDQYRTGAMYRLMRKDVMLSLLSTFSKLSKTSTPYIFEVTAEVIVNGLGKCLYIDNLYWIRNWINDQVQHKEWNRKIYFQDWWDLDEYRDERLRWIELMARTLDIKESNAQITEIIEVLNQKRSILETREKILSERYRAKIPLWVKKIKRYLTPQIFVKNSVEKLVDNEKKLHPETDLELSTALSFLE